MSFDTRSPYRIALESLWAWTYFSVRHLWFVWAAILLCFARWYAVSDFEARCTRAGGVVITGEIGGVKCVTGIREIHP